MTIKIVHLITGLETGGAETTLYNLCCRLNRSKFCNTVISMTTRGTFGEMLEAQGIPVYALGMRRGAISLAGVYEAIRMLRSERPEILQTWLYHADLFGVVVAALSGVRKTIWNIRCSDMDMARYSWLSRAVLRLLPRLSRYPAVVIANSEHGKNVHVQLGYRPKRWMVIPNGIDVDVFRRSETAREELRDELGLPRSAFLVGHIARFDPMKDHRTFLQAVAISTAKVPQIYAIMAGKGVERCNNALTSVVNQLDLSERVKMLGERHDVARLMAALDVVVMSSLFGEGFPNVVAEAMACETPCVVTDVGDSARIVQDTGGIAMPGNAQMVADAIVALANVEPERRRLLGRAARQRICAHFDMAASIASYERCYEDVARPAS
ncbi:MAG: glycosyltransferase [Sulfurifustis sp.]